MALLVIICLVVAVVLFALAAWGVGGRINLIAAGLVFFVAAFLIPALVGAVH